MYFTWNQLLSKSFAFTKFCQNIFEIDYTVFDISSCNFFFKLVQYQNQFALDWLNLKWSQSYFALYILPRVQNKIGYILGSVSPEQTGSETGNIFYKICTTRCQTLYVPTVWKSTQKRYHAEIFSVKSHNKNLLNQLQQMHVFLPLGNISRTSVLNKFWRLVYVLKKHRKEKKLK